MEVVNAQKESVFRSELLRMQQELEETRSRMASVHEPANHQPLQRVRGQQVVTPYFGGGMTTPQPPRADRDRQRPLAPDPFRQVAIGGNLEVIDNSPNEVTTAVAHSPILHRESHLTTTTPQLLLRCRVVEMLCAVWLEHRMLHVEWN